MLVTLGSPPLYHLAPISCSIWSSSTQQALLLESCLITGQPLCGGCLSQTMVVSQPPECLTSHPEGDPWLVTSGERDASIYLVRQSGGSPSLEIAGCPSCPPRVVSVADFHHPDRRAWNRELLGLILGGQEVPPRRDSCHP